MISWIKKTGTCARLRRRLNAAPASRCTWPSPVRRFTCCRKRDLPMRRRPRPKKRPQAHNEGEKICTGHDLADVLAKTPLSPDEAKRWRLDLRRARKTLKPPAEKWR